MKKIINIQTIIVLLIILAPALAHAQPADPGVDVDAPLDGGLSVLIAGGIGYGIKRVTKKNKHAVL